MMQFCIIKELIYSNSAVKEVKQMSNISPINCQAHKFPTNLGFQGPIDELWLLKGF